MKEREVDERKGGRKREERGREGGARKGDASRFVALLVTCLSL